MDLNEYVSAVIKDELNKTPMLKRVKGVITDINGEDVTIRLNGIPEATIKKVTIKCPTNAIIAVDDVVWIYYWKNVSDGFILPYSTYGVGKFIKPGVGGELFNDYSTSGLNITGSGSGYVNYSSIRGYANTIDVSAGSLSLFNTHIMGRRNSITQSQSGSRSILNTYITGRNNTLENIETNDVYIIGISNLNSMLMPPSLSYISNIHIYGAENTLERNSNTFAFSSHGTLSGDAPSYADQYYLGYFPHDAAAASKTGSIYDDWTSIVFGCGYSNLSGIVNGMELRYKGDLNVFGAVNSNTGADYAEYEEWQDGNKKNADRRGLFVTEVDDFIRISNENDNPDEVLGIVSSTPAICGDAKSLAWKGIFAKDVFGNIETTVEEVENENGEKAQIAKPKINPDYRSDQQYTSRSDRPEFSPVAYVGKVIAIDDGTCEVNGYCKPGKGGVATKSEYKTRFRVRKRIDDTHVLVRIL